MRAAAALGKLKTPPNHTRSLLGRLRPATEKEKDRAKEKEADEARDGSLSPSRDGSLSPSHERGHAQTDAAAIATASALRALTAEVRRMSSMQAGMEEQLGRIHKRLDAMEGK